MGETTGIAWTDATHNHWIGCTKVSPGCANCYAAAYDRRWGGKRWGKGAPRTLTSEANRRKPLAWNKKAAALGKRLRVFCSSLADVFDEEVPAEWRFELFNLIRRTPNLDWQLLTKRPENIVRFIDEARQVAPPIFSEEPGTTAHMLASWLAGKPPANVWLGTTVEDQQRADERIPHLLAVPAAIRFLSVEPQLGPVEFSKWFFAGHHPSWDGHPDRAPIARIHWVIQGGESGSKARPFDLAWARDLRDQCAVAGVAYFCKQLGADARDTRPGPPFRPGMPPSDFEVSIRLKDRAGADPAEWPVDLRVQNFPEVRL